jgi:two-component system chemotaxis response regulator CheB
MDGAWQREMTGTPLGGFSMSAVVIGASTGGPHVLEPLLRALPADLPVPVAICQHMPPDFTRLWAERLDTLCGLTVKEAENGEPFRAGRVYIAPIGRHLRFRRDGRAVYVRLDADFADALFVPSIDFMMSSAADVFRSGALAVLLTGLGSDGALGMLTVRRAGGYTIIEDPDSAKASSMPKSAAAAGAVAESARAADLARIIIDRVNGVLGG